MAIKIQSTKDIGINGIKVMVYSPSGVGKTVLCSTAPNPVIISAESGLLSLAGENIPYVEVKTLADLIEIYTWATQSREADQFETVCLDSITEIAEVMLGQYKMDEKDPRQAYGRLYDDMSAIIRDFRDMKGKNVYFSAKQLASEDAVTSVTMYKPEMPGKKLMTALPYFFDEVFSLQVGQLEDKQTYRFLQTSATIRFEGKDRSGKLDPVEKPDLSYIFDKIAGVKAAPIVQNKVEINVPESPVTSDPEVETTNNEEN